jgi:hypothetical protein
MLKERALMCYAQRTEHRECPGLDTGLKPCRATESRAAATSAKAHAALSSDERSTVNCEPNAEALLEIESERLLKMLATIEIAVFQSLWELAADRDAPGLTCAQVGPMY